MDILTMLFVGLTCLGVGYFLRLWREEYLHLRKARREAQAELERRISEPLPQPGTMARPNYSAVAVLDQVDAMIKRLDEQEMDDLIDEMQMRGW